MSLTRLERIDRILEYLNGLPIDIGLIEWIEGFRLLLAEFFDDVDRVSINIATNSDLLEPKAFDVGMMVTQYMLEPNDLHPSLSVVATEDRRAPWTYLLEYFRRQGAPIERYHSPSPFDYERRNGAYLGTIFLWRERDRDDVSRETLGAMSELEEIIVQAFTGVILRHHYVHPNERLFHDVLGEMRGDHHLTQQEYRVITHRLMGQSYKDIAAALEIREDSVKKLLQSVYRKTKTAGHVEFIAKYLTPRIFPDKD